MSKVAPAHPQGKLLVCTLTFLSGPLPCSTPLADPIPRNGRTIHVSSQEESVHPEGWQSYK